LAALGSGRCEALDELLDLEGGGEHREARDDAVGVEAVRRIAGLPAAVGRMAIGLERERRVARAREN
jgi:hypothetical protein